MVSYGLYAVGVPCPLVLPEPKVVLGFRSFFPGEELHTGLVGSVIWQTVGS